jgi:hypothetical protein
MPGSGSHGCALTRRATASASAGKAFSSRLLFMACCVTRRPRAGTRGLESSSVGQAPPAALVRCVLLPASQQQGGSVDVGILPATEKRNVCDAVLPDALAIDTVTL